MSIVETCISGGVEAATCSPSSSLPTRLSSPTSLWLSSMGKRRRVVIERKVALSRPSVPVKGAYGGGYRRAKTKLGATRLCQWAADGWRGFL